MRLDLSAEQITAVLSVVAERVSATSEEGTPLEQAERELDAALLAHERKEN